MRGILIGTISLALFHLPLFPAAADEGKIIIAHRGACGYLPEHTLAGKAVAHTMGADYLEQDLVLTKDGVPMVMHDIHIDTVTDVAMKFPDRKRADGRYYAIDFTLKEIKQLAASERFDPKTGKAIFPTRFPVGTSAFSVPTLEEEIQLVQGLNHSTGKKTGIYPEIKSPAFHRKEGQDISKIVLELLARYGYKTKADPFYLQCFDFEEVKRIRTELGFQGKLIMLIDDDGSDESTTDYVKMKTRVGLEEIAKVADGVGPDIDHIVKGRIDGKLQITELVKIAHELKMKVHPYTFRADKLRPYVTNLEELLKIFFVEVGVDGAFCDQPDRGVAFLKKNFRVR